MNKQNLCIAILGAFLFGIPFDAANERYMSGARMYQRRPSKSSREQCLDCYALNDSLYRYVQKDDSKDALVRIFARLDANISLILEGGGDFAEFQHDLNKISVIDFHYHLLDRVNRVFVYLINEKIGPTSITLSEKTFVSLNKDERIAHNLSLSSVSCVTSKDSVTLNFAGRWVSGKALEGATGMVKGLFG